MHDKWGAFVSEEVKLKPTAAGRLSGLTFAVKDVIAIGGHTSGAGNPDWLRTHQPESNTATAIERLLAQGAELVGMTHTDELMYSLNGENFHYGTPVNPKAIDRIPGGSSSGSAVAVSAELVDFSIGTDTGGSVRIPSSYCGIYGFRPSHGVISMEGVIPLAESFDTLGWMANDADVLLQVGLALLNQDEVQESGFKHVYIGKEPWGLLDSECKEIIVGPIQALRQWSEQYAEAELAQEGLAAWMDAFRHLQGLEIWRAHGEWIQAVNPKFGPGIADRFKWASSLREEDSAAHFALRESIRNRLSELLGRDGLLIIPTAPGIAPPLNQSGEDMEKRRNSTLQLSCIAGLSGLPQLHIPCKAASSAPFGISVIAGHGRDAALLSWVKQHASLLAGEITG